MRESETYNDIHRIHLWPIKAQQKLSDVTSWSSNVLKEEGRGNEQCVKKQKTKEKLSIKELNHF